MFRILIACLVVLSVRLARAESAPVDRYDDPLPPRALARMGTIRLRHGDAVSFAGFAADGKTLIAAGADQVIRFWDPATGKELRHIKPAEGQGFSSIQLSADGTTLAAVIDNQTIQLWDAATGKELRKRTVQNSNLNIALSADAKTIAFFANDQTLRVWDTTAAEGPRVLAKLEPPIQNQPRFSPGVLALSPDGKVLALGGTHGQDGVVRRWDVAAAKELDRWPGFAGGVQALAFAPDGKGLAVADGRQQAIHLLNLATSKVLREFAGQRGGATAPAFAPDGKTLAAVSNGSVSLWDTLTGKELRQLPAQAFYLMPPAFSPDGKTLAIGSGLGNRVRLWDLATGKELHVFGGHQGEVAGVALAPDGKTLATASLDQTVRLWETATGKEIRQFIRPELRKDVERVENVAPVIAFAPDGRTLVGGYSDGTLCVWDAHTGKLLRDFAGHGTPVVTLAYAPTGKALATGGNDGLIRVWDPTTGRRLRELKPSTPRGLPEGIFHNGPMTVAVPLAFSPDGKTLAVGRPDTAAAQSNSQQPAIGFWEIATGQVRGHIVVPDSSVGGTSAWGDYLVIISGDVRSSGGLRGNQPPVTAMTYGPRGQSLAFSRGDTLYLWEWARRRELRHLQADVGQVSTLAFSPDGKTLAIGSREGRIHFWDVESGTALGQLEAGRGGVTSIAFSADGRTLASGGTDTTALIWDVQSVLAEARRQKASLPAQRLQALWNELGSAAPQAAEAIGTLAAAPREALPLLQKHLRPVPHVDASRVARLVADLDHQRYEVRQRSSEELEKLGDLAEPALRRVLQGKPSLEMRQRVEQLVQKIEQPIQEPDQLRALRAIEVLEQIDTPEARQLLERLAKGAPESRLTQEAQAALERLTKQR
jgi:WD40 repeat protein